MLLGQQPQRANVLWNTGLNFHMSIHPSVHTSPPQARSLNPAYRDHKSTQWSLESALSGMKPALLDLKSALSSLKSALSGLKSSFWAASPKGMKSCRTQGDFRSFVRPSALSGLKSALSGLKSTLSGLKSALSGLESERADLRPERTDFRPERADFRPERVDFRPERTDFRPERVWGGQMGGRMDGRTKVPLCCTGLRPLRGRCPKS